MSKVLVGNIKGPQGDPGPEGPEGPEGPAGPPGPAPDATGAIDGQVWTYDEGTGGARWESPGGGSGIIGAPESWPSTFNPAPHSHPASDILNSTTVGRGVLTAADAATARSIIQAAPSSTVSFPGFGTTSDKAAPGSHTHPAASIQFTATPALPYSDVQAAIEAASTMGGSGTGGGGTADWNTLVNKPATFNPAPHTHPVSDVSNATAIGRSLVTAVDAQTARAAIGAGTGNGTSNLTLGTTATTAAPGNHNHNASTLQFTPDATLGLTAVTVEGAIKQAAQSGGGGAGVTTTLYVKYSSGQYPALPVTKPAGVQMIQFEGPVQPTAGNVSGGIPTYLGDGATQIMADYNYRNLT